MPDTIESKRMSEAGLTMVEISVTVLIIATVLTFALPMANNSIRAYRLRNAGDHMAERIAAVRALAMSKNRNVTFSFNNASEQFGFDFDGADGDGIPDASDPDDASSVYLVESLPGSITPTFPNNEPIKVTFNSRGEMPIGMTEQAIVLHSGSRSLTVRVNLRGKVSVE